MERISTDIIEIIQYHLEKEGYLVKSATNGLECLTVAKSFVPDLILLDVMMPEMDGIEACVELRKENVLKGTLIAFLTARSEDYSQVAWDQITQIIIGASIWIPIICTSIVFVS